MTNLSTLNKNYFDYESRRDLLAEVLADKRSEQTKRAYEKDLKDFFLFATGTDPNPEMISQFLALDRFKAIAIVSEYKSSIIKKKLSESTLNRRLAAVKALVNYAQKIGKCDWSLQDIKGEKVKKYRDTSGINLEQFKRMLAIPDLNTLVGKRDYALLKLLWDNVLRRGEVSKLNISDLDVDERKLAILGKGKGTQKENVSLSKGAIAALQEWLAARGDCKLSEPLFVSLPRHTRLTGDGIYYLISQIAIQAGINKRLSPHRLRHSGITAALKATNGDVRRVQKLSRHSKVETLMIYDDNRINHQGEMTDLLDGLTS
jgi:integrase/recombinase XerC